MGRAARFDNINLLRALAALSVLVYHVIEHAGWSSFPVSGPLSAFRLGWLGVDLFFVISGFVIAYSALRSWRESPASFAGRYWAHRLARIVPLYLLTVAIWVLFFWNGFFAQPTRIWTFHLASHLGFVHTFWPETFGSIDGANWSVGIEMQFYLAIALLVPWIDRTPGWRIWLAGILVAWGWRAAMAWAHVGEGGNDVFVHVSQLPGCLDEFGAGIFLAKIVLGEREFPPLRAAAWIAAAAISGWATMAVYWPRASYWDIPGMVVFWRTALAAFLACVVAAAVYLPQAIARRWLAPIDRLGEVSYGIYLWHLLAIDLAMRVFGSRPVPVLLATLVMTLVAASLSWRWLEKPVIDFARRGTARRPGEDAIDASARA